MIISNIQSGLAVEARPLLTADEKFLIERAFQTLYRLDTQELIQKYPEVECLFENLGIL